MTLGEKAYLRFNEALGMDRVVPFTSLRPRVKMAWERTAEYMVSLSTSPELIHISSGTNNEPT